MSRQKSSDPGKVRPLQAFQTDPAWYENHWYGPERRSTSSPIRRHIVALAALMASLHRLIAERPAKRTPVTTLQGTS
jgi:hypothetical protein